MKTAKSRIPTTPALVRMRQRSTKPAAVYWDKMIADWSCTRYTKWHIEDWKETFKNYQISGDREWEFFGYRIPLYDDEDEG